MTEKKAFSLLELSIAITIIAVLISAVISSSKPAIEAHQTRITHERIKEIYQAMGNYLATNKRLPCPASIRLAKSNANYGTEVACGANPTESPNGTGIWQCVWSNNIIYGMVPVTTLGLPKNMAEDGFGNKLAYVIIRGFTNSTTFGTDDPLTYGYNSYTGSSFYWTSCGRIAIHEKTGSTYRALTSLAPVYTAGGYCSDPRNQEAIFVIISNGPNQYGAWPANSTSQDTASFSKAGFPASTTDEGFNMFRYDTSTNYTYGYFYNYGLSGSDFWYPFVAKSDNPKFDDIVFYKTRNQMVDDFNLHKLISCTTNTSQSLTFNGDTRTYYWTPSAPYPRYGDVLASSTSCSGSNSTYGPNAPTKRCGKYGIWESGIVNDCLIR